MRVTYVTLGSAYGESVLQHAFSCVKNVSFATADQVPVSESSQGRSVSHDEGSSDAKKSSDRAPSLNDTVPGVPDIELGRTLQTGAAFHATAVTYPTPTSPMPNTPASLPRHDTPGAAGPSSSAPKDSERASGPPSGTGGPLTFGTTRQEFSAAPKVSAREKAKRNVLTHTLQMPMTITPMPPPAANPSGQPSASKQESRRATIKGTQPPGVSLLPGWTSMHRVGMSSPPPETWSSRPPAHNTDRNLNAPPPERGDSSQRFERSERADRSERFERNDPSERVQRAQPVSERAPEPRHNNPTLQDQPFSWQNPPPSGREMPRWSDRARMPEYDRETLPESAPIRIPALSAREWLFIALLACASAATLYSLLVDDMTTPVEEATESVTGAAAEHVVTPAPVPDPQRAQPEGETKAAAPVAANANVTEIVSEPAHAEIVVGGAVVGNTPAQVVRGDKDADYLLRKTGYEPELVRVTPHSPKHITITLRPKQ